MIANFVMKTIANRKDFLIFKFRIQNMKKFKIVSKHQAIINSIEANPHSI